MRPATPHALPLGHFSGSLADIDTMSQKAQPNTAKSNQSVCLEILPPPTSSRQQKKEHKHKQTRKEKITYLVFIYDFRIQLCRFMHEKVTLT